MQDWKQFEEDDFAVDYVTGGTRYVLPRRKLGRMRHAGWAVLAVGGFVTAFMLLWMSGPIAAGIGELRKQQAFGWMPIAFGCLGVFGLVPGLGLLMSGLAVLLNRTSCVVEIRNGVLFTKERLLLARWRRKRKASRINRLRLSLASESKANASEQDLTKWLGFSQAALVAEADGGQEFLVAVAYPRALLLRLAEEIAPKLEAEVMLASSTIEREPSPEAGKPSATRCIDIVEGPPEDDETVFVPSQPEDSVATIERRPFGITIDIPAVGIWKGSRGLMFFAVLWNGFMCVFITVAILGMTGAVEVEGDDPPWFLPLLLIPFVAVGIGTLLTAINMGQRTATIATADDLVMIVRNTIFGKKKQEWRADQIMEICVGSSGMEVNDVPIMELQVHPIHGKKFGCLSQLSDDELRWVVGELQQALQIRDPDVDQVPTGEYAERDQDGRVQPHPDSRISVSYAMGGVDIQVPARGFLACITGVIFGSIFIGIAVAVAFFAGREQLKNGLDGSDLLTFGFIGLWSLLFGGGGAAAFFGSVIMAYRRFQITADRYQLTVVRSGIFGRRTFTWERDALEAATLTATGTKVNDRAHYQVSIQSRDGDSVGIMAGQNHSDLSCVAAAINETLGLAKANPVASTK